MQFNKDEYKLKGRLNDGANSRVEILESQNGVRIVKKTIKDITKYTIRETQIAGELYLSQENIVSFYHIELDYVLKRGYIYMECCEKDLSQYQKQIQNSRNEKEKQDMIVDIAIHIVQGYQFLIKKFPSFMHRDIKPQNIFLKDDIWKIGDFGCSKIESDILQTGVIGTQYYLAPEVMKGEYDNKCDIYSLGILMYQFVYGSPQVDLQKIKNANFQKLIGLLTSKDASHRPDWFQIYNYLVQFRKKDDTIYNIQKQPILIHGCDFEMQVLKAQLNMSNQDSNIQHYDIQPNIIDLNKLFADVVILLEPDDQVLIKQQSQICLRAAFQLLLRVYDKNLKKYIKNDRDKVDGLNEQKKLVQWQQILRLDQYQNQQGQVYDRNVEFQPDDELIKIINDSRAKKDEILQKFVQKIQHELI